MTFHTPTIKQNSFIRRSPVFYGWVIWAVATVGMMATSPGQSYSVSLFIDHFIADFGLDRTTVSGLYGLGTFAAAFALTWVGRQIDRRGNRAVGVVTCALFALALVACSLINGPLAILLGFTAVRGLGQGALSLTSSTSVATWFRRRRGRVMSFSLVVFALFQHAYLPGLQSLIDSVGWRQAWIVLGIGIAVIILPLFWLLMRDEPEEFGLVPDGKTDAGDGRVSDVPEENWTLAQAMRTPMFWVFTFGRALVNAWGTGLIFHQISLFAAHGHNPLVAAETFGAGALLTALFTLLSGWIVDRARPNNVIAFQLVGLLAANVLATMMTGTLALTAYAVAFGVTMGVGSVFDGAVWVNLFGRQHQGAIRGFVATTLVIGTSAGPILFGISYDTLGSYSPALLAGAALSGVAIVLCLFVRKPRLSPQPA